MGELRSQKQRRERLVCSLRAEGKSRVEVAEVFRQRYRFNARVALRYAHGWSQRRAADEWNRRWPHELKTFKSFLDRSFTRDLAMTIVDLGEAYVQCDEIDEAARLFGDAGDIAASHSSARLVGRLEQARVDLQPWRRTAAVRTLDDRLASHGLA